MTFPTTLRSAATLVRGHGPLNVALGLGAAVSIFSVVNRVLLAPLPYDDPERLVWISTWNAERGQGSKTSGYDFNVWKQRTRSSKRSKPTGSPYTVTGTTSPEGLVGWQFTPGLFAMLGTPAAQGRTFLPMRASRTRRRGRAER